MRPVVIPIYAMTGEITFEGADDCHDGACPDVPRRGKAARHCTESTALVASKHGARGARAGRRIVESRLLSNSYTRV